MPAKNYASTRYSGLDQINAANAKNLRVAWTSSMGSVRGEEAAPLVVNNTMYVVSPFPNHLYGHGLMKPGAPLMVDVEPKNMQSAAKGVACCDWAARLPA